MADTAIEWADRVWNPTTGCDRVSPGCDHCYAMTMAKRLKGMGSAKYQRDGDPRTSGPGFGVSVHPDVLGLPLKWRKPQRIFVNSMSDLFHDQVPDEYIAKVFAVMAVARRHTFQVLTKRHGRMRAVLSKQSFPELVTTWAWRIHAGAALGLPHGNSSYSRTAVAWPLPNVWLGVSAENQQWANIRIPALLDTPAAVRFVSAEPLLGPIDLTSWIGCPHDSLSGVDQEPIASPTKRWRCDQCRASVLDGTVTNVGLHWVITGGESGPGARPAHPDWFRSIRDQCQAVGVAYLHKQNGEFRRWQLSDQPGRLLYVHRETGAITEDPYDSGEASGLWTAMCRVGKHRAGRELDGRTWDGYPGEAS